MELFTVWTNTDGDQEIDRFYEVVKSRTKGLHMSRRGFRFTFRQLDNKVAWTCKGTESNSAFESFLPCVYSIMSSAIADYIIEVREWGILDHILNKACSLLEKEDVEQIRSMIRSLLNDDGPRGRLKRHSKLTTLLEKDFKELRVINLEGLIQFRLHAYKKELEEIVDYAMEEFWADRQYEEFMGLLKYFVFFQESKVPLVHVLHQGGHDFIILDSAMVPIPTPDADDIIVEMPGIELEMEVEDRIVSTLISISPASIILHTDDEHTPIVRTLLHIFEDKVKLSRLYPGQDVQK
ncbi:putative sporulation protein YtxC [Paenibacillus polymyxa]|uniref:putative sporulation protein YtxC n=1 Tax=Paenibacillus polymyxa TaxID=1406 RepID=UPI000C9FF412|nr:putative sporulation protein YtxC [Paenibacillus polymyxa]PNQ86139.1 sporulation protein [Paenibacillus polymyxa]